MTKPILPHTADVIKTLYAEVVNQLETWPETSYELECDCNRYVWKMKSEAIPQAAHEELTLFLFSKDRRAALTWKRVLGSFAEDKRVEFDDEFYVEAEEVENLSMVEQLELAKRSFISYQAQTLAQLNHDRSKTLEDLKVIETTWGREF